MTSTAIPAPLFATGASDATVTAQPSSTNTFVGQKAAQLRTDLARLQQQVTAHSQTLDRIRTDTVGASEKYFQTTAQINARLQAGTTPGNPILTQQYNAAQAQLEAINEQVARLNTLAGQVGGDATLASFLLDGAQNALALSGALEEDHRVLRQVQDDTQRAQVTIQRLLNQVTEDVSRQSSYVANERRNLNTLSVAIKNGELLGGSLANATAPVPVSARLQGPVTQATSAQTRGTPLVTIRFDRPNPSYQQQLYTAVSTALERRPNATFDLVALSPAQGSTGQVALSSSAAQKNAESVLRALSEMGLPANRVRLSATTSRDVEIPQVELFVR